jgi:hypothetical protein
LPRWLLLPPASPVIRSSGCPSFRISGFTGDRSSSCLDSLSFGGAGSESSRLPLRFAYRYRRRSVSGSPQMLILRSRLTSVPSHLGAPCHPAALVESPDCSVYSLWASSLKPSPSRPGSRLLNVADSVCLESPRNFLPRLIRICFHRLRLFPPLRLGR